MLWKGNFTNLLVLQVSRLCLLGCCWLNSDLPIELPSTSSNSIIWSWHDDKYTDCSRWAGPKYWGFCTNVTACKPLNNKKKKKREILENLTHVHYTLQYT